MELMKIDGVIDLLKKANNFLYKQEKLYIFIKDKSYIIHNVNQKSYDYLLKTSGVDTPIEV